MRLIYHYELIKQTPLAGDRAKTTVSFYGGNRNRENAVYGALHKLLALALACFDSWLKPLFGQAERQTLSPIQECDPYVKGLLRYLQGQRMD